MNKPLFFLFTCVKDGNQYIEKLFNSLLKQSKHNFIHFIYEDGSTNPLGNLVEDYKKRASELKNPYEVIYEYNPKNIGLNLSTKHCIDKCCLPYFIWINCDDWIDKNFFKNLEKYVRHHKNALVFRSNKFTVRNNIVYSKGSMNKIYMPYYKHPFQNISFKTYMFSIFAVNYNQYKKINPKNYFVNDKGFFNDVQVTLAMNMLKGKFINCKKSISYFFCRNDSIEDTISNTWNNQNTLNLLSNLTINKFERILKLQNTHSLYIKMSKLISDYQYNEAKKIYKLVNKSLKKLNINDAIFFKRKLIIYKTFLVFPQIHKLYKATINKK